jgi:hypothetical protein
MEAVGTALLAEARGAIPAAAEAVPLSGTLRGLLAQVAAAAVPVNRLFLGLISAAEAAGSVCLAREQTARGVLQRTVVAAAAAVLGAVTARRTHKVVILPVSAALAVAAEEILVAAVVTRSAAQGVCASFGAMVAPSHQPTQGTYKWNTLISNSISKSATDSRMSIR